MKEGGARPKEETTEEKGEIREAHATSSPVTVRGDENLLSCEQLPVGWRERRTAAVSFTSSAVQAHDFSELVKAPGNADGLETLKFF